MPLPSTPPVPSKIQPVDSPLFLSEQESQLTNSQSLSSPIPDVEDDALAGRQERKIELIMPSPTTLLELQTTTRHMLMRVARAPTPPVAVAVLFLSHHPSHGA
jgi:hypothetical protein